MEAIYVWNENCVGGGRVYPFDPYNEDQADLEANGDLSKYADTEEEAVAKARLKVRYDTRAGGADDAFDWKCARNVLEYLGVESQSEEEESDE